MVPVGAIDVCVALRSRSPRLTKVLLLHLGKVPRSSASNAEARCASLANEFHDLTGESECCVTRVWNVHENAGFGETHDAQADLSPGQRGFFDLPQRIAIDGDYVVKEADGMVDGFAQALPVERGFMAICSHEVCEIDGSEIATFVR